MPVSTLPFVPSVISLLRGPNVERASSPNVDDSSFSVGLSDGGTKALSPYQSLWWLLIRALVEGGAGLVAGSGKLGGDERGAEV